MNEISHPISESTSLATREMIDQIVAVDPELLRCQTCGYIIHEDGTDHCPECGVDIDMRNICKHAIDTNHERFKLLWYTQVAELPVEDLCCTNCAYRLVGLTTNRCPECGEEFDWDNVCDAAISKSCMLFEFQWFADPLKSLAKTYWIGVTSPFRLWRTYPRSDTPRVTPLVILILVQWLVFARGWHAMALAIDPLMNKFIAVLPGLGTPRMRFTYGPRYENNDLITYALWSVGTLLTLQLFVQSKREHRVHWRQVLRVFAHSTLLASLCTALWCVLEAVLDSTLYYLPWPQDSRNNAKIIAFEYYAGLGNCMMGLALASIWVMLWIGYKKYLRIPHGWAIAAVALFVGHLAAQCVNIASSWEY